MRKSLQDIAFMVKDIPYSKPLPAALQPLHCYVADGGHCILAVPEALLPEAEGDYQMYEVPLPARFVLERGWTPIPGTDSVAVSVPYDAMMGALVPDGYEEF